MNARILWQRSLLVALGVVLACLIAEAVVRLTGLAPQAAFAREGRYRLSSNPKLGYEPTPGLYYREGELKNYDYYAPETNRLGYRDRDHPEKKPPGRKRIVILGDSITAGLWVDRFAETFPAVLEVRLQRGGLPVEVLNFGVVGYNTQQEVETLKEKGLRFEPDLVILAYCLNDRERQDGFLMENLLNRRRQQGGLNWSLINPWLGKSALYLFLRYRVFAGAPSAVTEVASRAAPDVVSEDTVDESFAELGNLAERHHFPVLVVLFPYLENIMHYEYGAEHERTRALCEAHGFDFLDLLPAYQEWTQTGRGRRRIGLDKYHPSALGHQCAAVTIADRIMDRWKEAWSPPAEGEPAAKQAQGAKVLGR